MGMTIAHKYFISVQPLGVDALEAPAVHLARGEARWRARRGGGGEGAGAVGSRRGPGARADRDVTLHHLRYRGRGPRPSVHDLEKLDVEDEHALRRTRAALIRELLRDPEAPLLTDDHELQPFGPTLDDAIERKDGGLPAGE